ncbi:MarR family transcriptional regulator [Tersicoccus sp. MR15.9]|uniref:MarR family winged helix-turn-helix transcriptional regulator n=1 Tax=Tersicoccus mangrovi TaxID=3121635 RepID=UPI002FE68AA9
MRADREDPPRGEQSAVPRHDRSQRSIARRPGYPLLLLLQRMTSEIEYYGARMRRRAGVRRTDMHAVSAVVEAERENEEMTPGRLGAMLGLSSSSVTALVDRLCEAGHLDRGTARADARRVALHANDTGRQVAMELFDPLDHALMEVFDRYSPSELDLFSRMIGDLTSATAAAGGAERATSGANGSRPDGARADRAPTNGTGSNGAAPDGAASTGRTRGAADS